MILNLHIISYFFEWLDQNPAFPQAVFLAIDPNRCLVFSYSSKNRGSGLYNYRGHGINGAS